MVRLERKREAGLHVGRELSVSERRATASGAKEAALAAELRRISVAHPRAGYRMATALLRRDGLEVHPSACSGSGGREGLKMPRRRRKR